MEQGWYNLLFAHWPISGQRIRDLVPPELQIDTFAGDAWVSIASFHLRLRPRGLSAMGKIWFFPELNLRTYVRFREHGGIFFFSLDAGSLAAVLGARAFFRVPYFHSRMQITRGGPQVHFKSQRRFSKASFAAEYQPVSAVYEADPGGLEHWLTERYCFFTVVSGKVFRTDIHHVPWPTQKTEAEISVNTLAAAARLPLEGPPALAGYVEQQEVLVWPLRQA
ncbi:MAG: YqjF family protein [Terracidiphilus sp.]